MPDAGTSTVKMTPSILDYPVVKEATNKRREEKNREADLALIQLLCAAGLPSFILSRPQWTNFLNRVNPHYRSPSRSRYDDELLPAEASHVQKQMYADLGASENLTLSVDGGTSGGREAFWTMHISTERRKVYFVECREATAESHTAQWLKTWVLRVIDGIGRARFCSVVCDSTGNTRLLRTLIVDTITTMFNLADICHHISNTIKDIVRIIYFKVTITVVRTVITKVHQSHLGTAEFDAARARLNIGRGLISIGKTRFGSIISSSDSVQRNLPAIREVIKQGNFSFANLDSYFRELPDGRLSRASSDFVSQLGQLVAIGKPALRSLTFLESNDASPGDVYVHWHAVLQAIDTVLTDPDQEIPANVRNEVIGILNHRHNQILGNGNLSDSADLLLSGAYLHPLYIDSDIFKHELVSPNSTTNQEFDYTGILFPNVFKKVANFLSFVGLQEIRHGMKTDLTAWKGRGNDFRTTLLYELQRYGRRQYPYNQPYAQDVGVATAWWRILIGQEAAKILPVLALKIHAVRVNSMAEERTASTFTWLSAPLRASLSVGTMTSIAQVRQFYKMPTKLRPGTNPDPSSTFKPHPPQREKDDPIDDEGDSWLDEPLESVEPAATLDAVSSFVNMDSVSLKSVLAGKKGMIKADLKETGNVDGKYNGETEKTDEDGDYILRL